jgi:hypothetical protein
MKRHLVLPATIALILILSYPCLAQRQIELIPTISVNETYDDNIYLTNTDKKSDFITAVSPSLTLNLLSQNTKLGVSYAPSFVWYADQTENDTIRHLANVNWQQQITQYVSFNLTDTYLNSEDPLQDTLDLQGIRRTRNKYWVNSVHTSAGYVFGTENALHLGYGREDRENKEITLDDSAVQTPFADVTYWLDLRNGFTLTYTYTDAYFSRENNLPPTEDDYTGHSPGIRYLRRFSPHSTGYIGYTYTTRDFKGLSEDYVVHNGIIGMDHTFSPEYTLSASLGYFIKVNDITDNQSGPTYTLALARNFSRGNITVGGAGGWEEVYLTRGLFQTTGYTQYYSGYVNGTYQLLEPLSIYAGVSYRHDKDELDLTSQFYRGNCGLKWTFLRWFSLALDYTYADRNDDIEINSYTDNRVMLILTASKPYRW